MKDPKETTIICYKILIRKESTRVKKAERRTWRTRKTREKEGWGVAKHNDL